MSDELTRLLGVAGVPPRFLDRRLDGFRPRNASQRAALNFATAVANGEPPSGGVLIGPVGTGKTHLGSAIVARRVERHLERWPEEFYSAVVDGESRTGRRPPFLDRFTGVPELVDRIGSWYLHPDDVRDPLAPLVEASLLILDDLGREKLTERSGERLYLLINRRYELCRPTIVTTNYEPRDLATRGYDALLSRVCEGGSRVVLSGDDVRRETT